MAVTIDQIKSLRDKTGVSTTQCKKALDEANGDESIAIDILRKKGAAKAAAREGVAGEGVVSFAISADGKSGVVVKIASETDFVAKNQDFVDGAKAIAEKFLSDGESADVAEMIDDLRTKMAEKIELGEVKFITGEILGAYIHSNNKLGAVVALNTGETGLAKNIAMHVTASQPRNLSPDEVDQTLVDKEVEIWKEQLAAEGKPENIMDKILEGKIRKYRGENALISQSFVMDPSQTVEAFAKAAGSEVTGFVFLTV